MTNRFQQLDSELEHKDAVLSFFSSMFKVGELMSVVRQFFKDRTLPELRYELNSSGKGMMPEPTNLNRDQSMPCEILIPGAKGWQKGKVRMRVILEFCPDEPEFEEPVTNNQPEISHPESSLDHIRQMINQENQQINQ